MDNNSNSKKKVALHNLGCKVNAYETEAMTELLIKAGSIFQDMLMLYLFILFLKIIKNLKKAKDLMKSLILILFQGLLIMKKIKKYFII